MQPYPPPRAAGPLRNALGSVRSLAKSAHDTPVGAASSRDLRRKRIPLSQKNAGAWERHAAALGQPLPISIRILDYHKLADACLDSAALLWERLIAAIGRSQQSAAQVAAGSRSHRLGTRLVARNKREKNIGG